MNNPEASSLPASAQRVADVLQTLGHPQPVRMLPASGRTSAEAAAALGCAVGAIAKSIIFRRQQDDCAVLVLASGAVRIDENKVASHCGPIGRADAAFVREKTGYAIGGVCPLGHPQPAIILLDRSLLVWQEVWAAAGHPHAVFAASPQQLQHMTGAELVDVAQV
ncbi:YbaK/EbsC family protein [Massilia sp. W12]|uniref:YbaK/EbsC family protein n=1 Tax=Massilia sp. W12 TaxID=3126507 RepID=UPI0030D3CB76